MTQVDIFKQPYATLDELFDWAKWLMCSRHPDIIIGEKDPAGDFVERDAAALHRIELIDRQLCVSLFTTGQKVHDWAESS